MKKFSKQILSILTIIIFSVFAIASSSSDDSAKSTSDEWYAGGTLHQATISEWKNATEKNKLATCADFVANVKKMNNESYNGDLVSMKKDATQMMTCIDEAVKGDAAENANMKINEVAATCAILLGSK